jgi:hypothetical protein
MVADLQTGIVRAHATGIAIPCPALPVAQLQTNKLTTGDVLVGRRHIQGDGFDRERWQNSAPVARRSGLHDLRDQFTVHVRQPHVPAIEAIGELGMVHAQQM